MSDFGLFEEEMERDRKRRVAEAAAANEAFAKHEAEQAAERAVQLKAHMEGANERHRLAEYRYHGVEPPLIDGVPTKTSFYLLRQLGWTVEDVLGRKQMVAPPAIEPALRRGREFYDSNS